MMNKHSITSGDNSINLQVSELKYFNNLSSEDLNDLRDRILQELLDQQKKQEEMLKFSSVYQYQTQDIWEADTENSIEPTDLVDLLTHWSIHQERSQRLAVLEKIFSSGLPLIFRNRNLAVYIRDHVVCDQIMDEIITPACKLSLDKRIEPSDLSNLIRALTDVRLTISGELSIQQQKYLVKIIFNILYDNDTKSDAEDMSKILIDLSVTNNELLRQFFVDAYFRICSNYLFTSDALKHLIEERASSFFSQNPKSPLTLLKRIILDPMEVYETYNYYTVVRDLSKIAFLCQNVVEARWVVSALFRILPLYKTEDIDIDYDEAKAYVINKFSNELLSRLTFMKYLELKNYLYLFHMTGVASHLLKYEVSFIRANDSLHLDQQICLQMEYASSIYMFLINSDVDALAGSRFADYVKLKEPNLIEKPLFANILVLDYLDYNASQKYINKGFLLKWLQGYIDRIYRLYIEKKLTQNPFMLFNYRATSKMPILKSKIDSIVTNYIIKTPHEYIISQPSYACKIISIIGFSKIAKAIECKKQLDYVGSALRCTRYEILLDAKSIAYVLYYAKYYCNDHLLQENINTATKKFKEIIPYKNKSPRIYWAITECITLSEQEREQDFIVSLHDAFENANPRIFKLSLRRGEDFRLAIPEKSIETITSKSKDGSILALIGIDYLMVTEYWNLLATTIFNLSFPNRVRSLEIASMFYSVAKCFARDQRNIDQKYSYNFIRVQSLYYELVNMCPPEVFFRDCSFYIDRPNNQHFNYKEECCEAFFKLIKLYYDQLPCYIRQLYDNQILPKRHWVKKAFQKMGIGIFSEEIKIK